MTKSRRLTIWGAGILPAPALTSRCPRHQQTPESSKKPNCTCPNQTNRPSSQACPNHSYLMHFLEVTSKLKKCSLNQSHRLKFTANTNSHLVKTVSPHSTKSKSKTKSSNLNRLKLNRVIPSNSSCSPTRKWNLRTTPCTMRRAAPTSFHLTILGLSHPWLESRIEALRIRQRPVLRSPFLKKVISSFVVVFTRGWRAKSSLLITTCRR